MKNMHELFKKYPLDSEVIINGEKLSSPYHIYDGSLFFVFGKCDANVATKILEEENMFPFIDENGKALMAVWIGDFTKANLDAHHELQISLFASFTKPLKIDSNNFSIFNLLITKPDFRMVCHGLWNNTKRVVDYNKEYLKLNAFLTKSTIEKIGNKEKFSFCDEDGNSIVNGELEIVNKQSPIIMWKVLKSMGFEGIKKAISSKFISIKVVNTKNPFSDKNLVASTYTHNSNPFIRYFNHNDKLEINNPFYKALNFSPEIIEQVNNVKMVYLRPE